MPSPGGCVTGTENRPDALRYLCVSRCTRGDHEQGRGTTATVHSSLHASETTIHSLIVEHDRALESLNDAC